MTVVARLAINDIPILIGDLLLSIEDPQTSPSPVPTVQDLSALFPAGSECVPCGLRQKLAVVDDNLVVGWAGSLATARDVIGELKQRAACQRFTYEMLTDHFDSLDQAVWNDISLVGCLSQSNDQAFMWGRGDRLETETKFFGKAAFIGSGLLEVEKIFQDVPHLSVGLERTLTPSEQALGFCLQMTGNLMQLEIATRKSLAQFYGGGYEIAGQVGGKYGKVDGITYMFWRVGVEPQGVRIGFAPYRVLRYAYEKDMLVIRAVGFDDSILAPVVTDQKTFFVEPVYRDASAGELSAIKQPSLNAKHLCIYFLVKTKQRSGFAVLAAVHRRSNPTDKKWVTFTETASGQIGLEVEKEFLQEVNNQVLTGMSLIPD